MLHRIIDTLLKPFLTPRFLKFGLVGASGVVVNLAFLALFRRLDVQINLASALAIELSLLSNFIINYLWTFGDRRAGGAGIVIQGLRFHLVCLAGAGVQFLAFVVMNMVWLLTLFDLDTRFQYHSAASSWLERWLWHPFVAPPEVGSWVYLSQLIGIGFGMFWNYLLSFHWTWAARPDTAVPAPAADPSGSR